MPKPQYKAAEGLQSSSGLPAGDYEIISNEYRNLKSDFDREKEDESGNKVKYKPITLNHVFKLAVLNADGDKVRGADEFEFAPGFGEKSLQAFHPGQADSRDDKDPVDQGVEPDAAGNTIFCVGEDEFSGSCAAWVFYESIVKLGFPKTKIGDFWSDDFNGLKLHIEQVGAVELNKNLGLRLNTKPMAPRPNAPLGPDGKPISEPVKYRVATKWLNAKEGVKKSTSKASAAPVESSDPDDDAPKATSKSAEDLAMDCLRGLAETKAGVEVANLTKLRGLVQQYWVSKKFPAGNKMAEALKFIADVKFITKAAKKLDGKFDDGVFTFPDADEAPAED